MDADAALRQLEAIESFEDLGPFFEELFDDLLEQFAPRSGDWREKNWRLIISTALPHADLEAAEESPSVRQLGLFAGFVQAQLISAPDLTQRIESATQSLASMGQKTADSISLIGPELIAILRLMEAIHTKCSTLIEEFVRNAPRTDQVEYYRAILTALESTRVNSSGVFDPPANQKKAFHVRTILFFFSAAIHNGINSMHDLHRMVVRFDSSKTFALDQGALEWDSDRKCIEGVCRSIGLKFAEPGRPRNPETE
jgi:hypothetical protein